jgi:quercetin dioxygenase-like cupin family protein
VTFVDEATGDSRTLGPGDTQVIPPESPHHVEPGPDARFVVEFYR